MIAGLKRFESANPSVREATWSAGAPITIEGVNGDVEVVRGSGDSVVRAAFTAFVYRKSDVPESEVAADLDKLVAEMLPDAGGVLVRSTRLSGSPSTLGADIVVEIPPAFDGRLSIQQDNGATDVAFAGNATGIELQSDNGTCEVACSAAATALSLLCESGDLALSVPGAPPGSEARTIRTEVGNIAVSFANVPATQPFSVQATASDGAVEITGGANCRVQEMSAGSKMVGCNGATSASPVYQVSANTQSDIRLTF